MKRLAEQELLNWYENPDRKPLIVWGARQVGKTHLVKSIFAEEKFPRNYVYIDFRLEDEIRDYCNTTVNPKKIVEFISAFKDVKIKENTLLIFDEIQECLGIITSLKYFNQELCKQPVIATGSMVRTKLHRVLNKRGAYSSSNEFLFPVGKINEITIYPMNFEEFFMNYNPSLYSLVVSSYKNKSPLNDSLHNLSLEVLHKYLMIGGMPEVVKSYINYNSYLKAKNILKDLYNNYLSDMQLYQASPESIIRSKTIFENIYSQLNKENKNFSPSKIERGSKNRDFRTPIDWLTTAFVVHKSTLLNERVTLPLYQSEDTTYRLYLADIGMFSYQSGLNISSFIGNNSNTLSGIFYENYVACEIISKGMKLFYWKGKNDAEIEFLVESNGEIYPIDVKKGKSSLNSLKKYRDHNSNKIAIKISSNNYGYDKENRILTIPLYQAFLLLDDLSNSKDII